VYLALVDGLGLFSYQDFSEGRLNVAHLGIVVQENEPKIWCQPSFFGLSVVSDYGNTNDGLKAVRCANEFCLLYARHR